MIRTLTSSAVLALSLLSAASLVNAQPWVAGEHYRVLDNPVRTASDNGVEVAEVFWYGCPHCYNFKPLAEAWEAEAPDYINYVKLPAALGRSWEPHAYAFYALEAMGELDKVHDALFDALAGERRPLNTPEALADFVAGYGVNAEKFLENYNSFGVRARVQQAQAKIRGARITGTPTMLVDGKYVVSASMAGSHENTLKVVEYLAEKERSGSE
ncbi:MULTISPECIES: thiol:disulfide interchange protein DsbA/DsbL [Marinobacter]|jgi:thiol:disulfide interchange protein DsbA|uniref:Thiol:disulfide interchange protein n=2 Tax=Marinobacter nauticus TaxID=2743 RepID=A0A368V752_MARNT|nr:MULTISPECIES: thiol:disulfide interchange protein DsbA/DsbL [Marinobacter]MEC8898407.1 thiol:disulfide interchange protein DsbA/DsbL [Pseudomonadota bacterium]ABM20637.1 DSBA oxidoreductase [Marinobacter nauticus VT8]ERS02657.1 thiol:disulfide interchange protein [Marinobacter sp. EN3]ERS82587.1 thiol:disulfide interchange protein [Marinobacter sp. EVN1]ERS83209.1 thiol:disulfide interchange protein [Marinobacter sp. C1S70]|tara:strand:+ start:377 stop:1015 length:639 start_codon:yes stop_codon:yes gene_type:complete